MRNLLSTVLFFISLIVPSFVSAQSDITFSELSNVSDLKAQLAKAKSPNEIISSMIALLIYHSAFEGEINKKAAEEYREKLGIFTNRINDPELTAKSLWWQTLPAIRSQSSILSNTERCQRIDRLYDFAKLKGLKFYQAIAKMEEVSSFLRCKQDNIQAVKNLNEALQLTEGITDSLKITVYEYATHICFYIGNYLQALKYAHKAYELAFKIRSRTGLRWAYDCLALVFTGLKEFEKANEYYLKEIELLQSEKKLHLVAVRHALIAANFILDNQSILAGYHIKRAEQLADSLKGSKLLYRQISTSFLFALVQSNHKNLLPDFFQYVYKESLNDWPNDKFLFLTSSALICDWFGIYDSAKILIKNASPYITEHVQNDILQLYYTTAGSIANHENDLDLSMKNYQQALKIDLLSNNLTAGLNLSIGMKNISVKQNQPDCILYYSHIADSLRVALYERLHKEEITRQEVATFERQKAIEEPGMEKNENQEDKPKYLTIAFCIITLLKALTLTFIFSTIGKNFCRPHFN